MRQNEIGSISHGTLRLADLIPTFIQEIKARDIQYWYRNLARYIPEFLEDPEVIEFLEGKGYGEELSHILHEDLWEALSGLAPPGTYFGAHLGDGADVGYWPDYGGIDYRILIGEIAKVEDPSELDRVGDGTEGTVEITEAVHVNDHGDMTYYERVEGGWRVVWSVV